MNNQEVLILLDSGSSSTFISSSTVDRLGLSPEEVPAVQVCVADGGKLASKQSIPELTWWTQSHTFTFPAKVLNLQCYDMILGMD